MKTLALAAVATTLLSAGIATAQSTSNQSQITLGAGWSSLYGPIGTAGVHVSDFLGTGLDVSGELRKGRKGYDTALSLGYATELGALGFLMSPEFFAGLDHRASDWSDDPYSGQVGEANIGIGGSLGMIDLSVGGFARVNKVSSFNPNASPIVSAEKGFSWTAGAVLGAGWDTYTGAGLSQIGTGVEATVRLAPLGTRHFVSGEVSARTVQPIFEQFSLAVSGEAGLIRGLGGQAVSVYDRVFLGGAAPRGFGIAGIGPRDKAGAVDTALGGTNYLLGSVEVRRPVFANTALGAFVDVASVWRLDGAPVGASGVIDDSFFLNAAVGATFYWETQVGTINLSVAKPVRLRAGDSENLISLGLSQSF